MITHGDIPPGLFVLHRCDNPPCCNPDHLFLGTDQDNVRDAKRKGRIKRLVGEENHFSKLTEEKVERIRNEYTSGNKSLRALGYKYEVTPENAGHIVHGQTWKHASGPTIKPRYRSPNGTRQKRV
jgi:hypothetical protein